MERDSRLVGAYGNDRSESLHHKSPLAHGERTLKDPHLRSPAWFRKSPLLEGADVHISPVSQHDYIPDHKHPKVRLSPELSDSLQDAKLIDYIWTQGNERRESPKPKAQYGGKAGDGNYNEVREGGTPIRKARMRTKGLVEGRRDKSSDSTLRRDVSPVRGSVESSSPAGRGKRDGMSPLPVPKLRRVRAGLRLDSSQRARREQQLEESIQELDELLARIKKRQDLRSSSVLKQAQSKSLELSRRRLVPRLKLPLLVE